MLDCGTGAVSFGAELMQSSKRALRGNLLISHTHWDHIQGLPFFAPLFVPGNEWDVYAPRGFEQSVRETLAGQMQSTYFPVELKQLGAAIRYHDLTKGVFNLGDIKVSTQYLNHPALALGYRLEADGVIVVYACDHEPHSRALAYGSGDVDGQDQRHAEYVDGDDQKDRQQGILGLGAFHAGSIVQHGPRSKFLDFFPDFQSTVPGHSRPSDRLWLTTVGQQPDRERIRQHCSRPSLRSGRLRVRCAHALLALCRCCWSSRRRREQPAAGAPGVCLKSPGIWSG